MEAVDGLIELFELEALGRPLGETLELLFVEV